MIRKKREKEGLNPTLDMRKEGVYIPYSALNFLIRDNMDQRTKLREVVKALNFLSTFNKTKGGLNV